VRILDTDVCVEILRGNRDVVEQRRTTIDWVATTWVTASELFYGAAKSRLPFENQRAVVTLLQSLEIRPPDLAAAMRFGRLKADLESRGERLADADLLIAAVALVEEAILVTGNVRHYGRIPDLRIEDWIRGKAGFHVNEEPVPYES
jgi:tRNA(fMet)-specific endonuclease VapC